VRRKHQWCRQLLQLWR